MLPRAPSLGIPGCPVVPGLTWKRHIGSGSFARVYRGTTLHSELHFEFFFAKANVPVQSSGKVHTNASVTAANPACISVASAIKQGHTQILHAYMHGTAQQHFHSGSIVV